MGAVLSRPARGVTGRVGAARCSGAPGTAKRGAGRDVDQMPWAAASSRWLRRSAVDIAIAVHTHIPYDFGKSERNATAHDTGVSALYLARP